MTLRYLIDTNVLSEPVKSRPSRRVVEAIRENEGELAICSIVWHELRFGVERLPSGKRRRAIEAYLDDAVATALPILPYDGRAAEWHARERARLSKRGTPPSAADGQIAAIAAVNGLIVVSANAHDFRGFRDLEVENWHTRR